MRFQISEVQADNYWVPLTDYRTSGNYENVFTLIVGQNAVGKSRLLRKIVSNYIFSQESRKKSEDKKIQKYETYYIHPHSSLEENEKTINLEQLYLRNTTASNLWQLSKSENHDTSEIRTSTNSKPSPANVIAVSTGRHDRFPSSLHTRKKIITDYHYIGADQLSRNSISSSLISLLEGFIQERRGRHNLSEIFEYLGFAPYLDIKISLDKRQYSRLTLEESFELRHNVDDYLLEFLLNDEDYMLDHSHPNNNFYQYLKSRNKTNLELHFWDNYFDIRHETISELIPFLKAGLIKIFDITLIKLADKSRLRLSQASSGQQCMLTIMLGIAGSIKDGSLVCIDEPEISLHPQWQTHLVRQLQEAFSNFTGCHFIIATHSPQLVSGLTHHNGYVLNLEERELYHSYDYASRSADFQLAEVFHTPGHSNEYLLRLTLLLLTKITKRETLNEEDHNSITKLIDIRKKMSTTDPVYHLISQVESLF